MRRRRSGVMTAWIFPLLACSLFFGCSSGSSGGGIGGQGGTGTPGCTTAPDCNSCGSCYANCYCQTQNSSQCYSKCTSGSGGTGAGGSSGSGSGGTSGSGAGGSSGSGAGGSSGSGAGGSSGSGSGGTSSDPFAAARQKCIDHINQLRATKGRAPYKRWTSIESCVDSQATYDSNNGPHADFIGGKTCGAHSQGECPGQGPSSVTNCIDLMWAEKDYSICTGCDSCPNLQQCFAGGCPNCQCTTGSNTCGHYMALADPVQTMAACGFSTSGKAYMTIDYK